MSQTVHWPATFRAACAAACLLALPAAAQHGGVAKTLHNLSISGPGEVRSMTETQVCKFCHAPHSAVVPVPLWGHALSEVKQYETPTLEGTRGIPGLAPQPDGSSRLCLSCHDGTVALGDLGRMRAPVPMTGASHLSGRRSSLGTDLSGSHPISFVVADRDAGLQPGSKDMGVKPIEAIVAGGRVRLDEEGKLQCTTCHDPHADDFFREGVTPHFWVAPTVSEVCLTCHELR